MAIEDAFQLGVDVAEAMDKAGGDPAKLDVSGLWGTYQAGRLVRAAAIHGMAREWGGRGGGRGVPTAVVQLVDWLPLRNGVSHQAKPELESVGVMV